MRANIVGGNNLRTSSFIHHNSRTINPRMVFLSCQRLRPRSQIRMISVGKSATLFHVQKYHRAFRKALPPGRRRPGSSISESRLDRIFFTGRLTGSSPLVQKQKSKSLRLHHAAFANPGITFFAGRRAQPIACEGIGFAKHRQRFVAGILVAIEAHIAAPIGRVRSSRPRSCEAKRNPRNG